MANPPVVVQYQVPKSKTTFLCLPKELSKEYGVLNQFKSKPLGSGTFGDVFLAYRKKDDEKVAIKRIEKSTDEDEQEVISREMDIMKQIDHPNIIKYYHHQEAKKYIYVVMEYAENGTLFDNMTKFGKFTEPQTRGIFRQILGAVRHIHSKGFVHRDIKSQNILFDSKMNVKLADFGLANAYDTNKHMESFVGTWACAPPELIMEKNYNGTKYDIWSMGILLFELLNDKRPFESKSSVSSEYRKIIKVDYKIPDEFSNECKELITKILTKDPMRRPSIEDIMMHKWMRM